MAGKKESKRPPPDFFLEDPDQTPSKPVTSVEYRANPAYHNSKAIVLDLGSSNLRAGFSAAPSPILQLPPYVARTRDPQTGLRAFQIGQEALCSSARSTARPAYDAGIPNNPALIERLLDGTLAALGLGEEDHIRHKYVLTEAPCQPNSARALIMELMFEAYEAPGICFGVDALFSYFYNRHREEDGELRYARDDAVVLSCGYNATHILPLVNGRLVPSAVKRVNVGGVSMTNQLTQRLQLLHPEHSSVLTPTRVELLKEKLCYVSPDYDAELLRIKNDIAYYEEITKTVKVPTGDGADKPALSPEEQERLKQARIENGRRLSETMKKRNAKSSSGKDKESTAETEDTSFTEEEVAKLYDAMKRLYDLQRIDDMRDIDEDKYYIAMLVHNFESSSALSVEIDKRQAEFELEREKLGEAKSEAAEAAWWKRVHEDELLSMSDSELSAAELKRKRHVRAMRGAAEARIRAKRAKQLEREAEERKAAAIRQMREEKPEEYLAQLRSERDALADRLKRRIAAREAGSDRRSQAARERMRLLAQHAGNKPGFDDGPGPTSGGKGRGRGRGKGRGKGRGRGRGRGGGRGKRARSAGDDDTFGMNDSDWDVYKSMKVGNAGSDSDDNSSEERERLQKIREEISDMVPDDVDPTMSIPKGAALLFEENVHPDEFPITIDRLRTGEIVFQPSLAGMEQCGMVEALRNSVSSVDRSSIVREVFLTGGVSQMRGLRERVCSELRMSFPTEWGDDIVRGVRTGSNATLDAWRGAAMFAERGGARFDNACITKEQFLEMGNGYLREHWFSNVFFKTPILTAADLELKKKMQKQAGKRGRPKSFG